MLGTSHEPLPPSSDVDSSQLTEDSSVWLEQHGLPVKALGRNRCLKDEINLTKCGCLPLYVQNSIFSPDLKGTQVTWSSVRICPVMALGRMTPGTNLPSCQMHSSWVMFKHSTLLPAEMPWFRSGEVYLCYSHDFLFFSTFYFPINSFCLNLLSLQREEAVLFKY